MIFILVFQAQQNRIYIKELNIDIMGNFKTKHKKVASGCCVSLITDHKSGERDLSLSGRPSFGSILTKKSVGIV